MSVCLSLYLPVFPSACLYSVLFAIFCIYLGYQLRWAICFSDSPPLCIVLFVFISMLLHSWLHKSIDWLIFLWVAKLTCVRFIHFVLMDGKVRAHDMNMLSNNKRFCVCFYHHQFIIYRVLDKTWISVNSSKYCKTSDRSRVPHKRRVPDTSRGSRTVLIEAGFRINAGSRIQAGDCHCLAYCLSVKTLIIQAWEHDVILGDINGKLMTWRVLIEAGSRINAGSRIQARGQSKLYW